MKNSVFLIFILFINLFALAQYPNNPAPSPYYPYTRPFTPSNYPIQVDSSEFVKPKLLHPVVGIGPGILTFYGDVTDQKITPSISRLGYHLTISEYLSRSVLLSARALVGTLGSTEKNGRNMNFESSIRLGGLNITYNFDNFLPEKRRVDPFVLTGFEYFEYLSKTDLLDASGNQYHYWSNGSIMNLDENDPNADNAILLIRDYNYETDLRKWNNDLLGKYAENSFAVPVGVGINMHLAPRWEFKLGTTLHFTFTDYVDGVTEINKGTGKGDTKKDKFVETYFTLTFELFQTKTPFISPFSDEEFLAFMNEDADGDGVTDFIDSCQGTPSGVVVDAKGCPLDSDGDRFVDYLDKETNSPPKAFVDENGVTMTDSAIAHNYHAWKDSAGGYNLIVKPTAVTAEGWNKIRDATIVYRRELVILLGAYKEGVPPAEMGKLLSVPDVRSSVQPDSTTAYIAGSYNKTVDAEKRKDAMIAAGFTNAKIMVKNKDGSLTDSNPITLIGFEGDGTQPKEVDMNGVVYRVQLGAYSKKLSPSVFRNAGGATIELKTEQGLYKYMSGSFASIQDALKRRDELVKRGYGGSFVVAYKENKRVPLAGVSEGIIQPKNENIDEIQDPKSAIDKKLISFRVQVGTFANEPPADIIEKINLVPGIEKKTRPSGAIQYVAGKFSDYESAKNFREDVLNKYGIQDAFVIAYFNNNIIPVQEAIELLK